MGSIIRPVVVLISADAEWAAVKDFYCPLNLQISPYGEYFVRHFNKPNYPEEVIFFQGGWGKISAAGSTQYVIDSYRPCILLNLGTCGGIKGRVARNQVVLAERTMVYDLIEMMDSSEDIYQYYTTNLDLSFLNEPYPIEVTKLTILSADRDLLSKDIPALVEKYDARVCDWESAAIAFVAEKNGVPLFILRGVSDLVSLEGGEAYGDLSFFQNATQFVMNKLLSSLDDWLGCIDYQKVLAAV